MSEGRRLRLALVGAEEAVARGRPLPAALVAARARRAVFIGAARRAASALVIFTRARRRPTRLPARSPSPVEPPWSGKAPPSSRGGGLACGSARAGAPPRRARRPRRRACASSAARPRRAPSPGRAGGTRARARAASSSRRRRGRRSGSSASAPAASSLAAREAPAVALPREKEVPQLLPGHSVRWRLFQGGQHVVQSEVRPRRVPRVRRGAPRERAHRGPHDVRERFERALVGRGEASLPLSSPRRRCRRRARGFGRWVAATSANRGVWSVCRVSATAAFLLRLKAEPVRPRCETVQHRWRSEQPVWPPPLWPCAC